MNLLYKNNSMNVRTKATRLSHCHQTFKFFSLWDGPQRKKTERREGGPGQVLNSVLLAERRAVNGFGWGLKREAAVSINPLQSSSHLSFAIIGF
jgi:hypothetical protein